MNTEQPTGFGKRRSKAEQEFTAAMQNSANREEAREALSSLAMVGQEINAEIMKLSVAAMNGLTINRERRDSLLVLSKRYDQLVQAIYAGNEAEVKQVMPGFVSLLERVLNSK